MRFGSLAILWAVYRTIPSRSGTWTGGSLLRKVPALSFQTGQSYETVHSQPNSTRSLKPWNNDRLPHKQSWKGLSKSEVQLLTALELSCQSESTGDTLRALKATPRKLWDHAAVNTACSHTLAKYPWEHNAHGLDIIWEIIAHRKDSDAAGFWRLAKERIEAGQSALVRSVLGQAARFGIVPSLTVLENLLSSNSGEVSRTEQEDLELVQDLHSLLRDFFEPAETHDYAGWSRDDAYLLLISHCADQGHFTLALHILGSISRGSSQEPRAYNIILSGYQRTSQYLAVQRLYKSMNDAGVCHNMDTFEILIQAHLSHGMISRALQCAQQLGECINSELQYSLSLESAVRMVFLKNPSHQANSGSANSRAQEICQKLWAFADIDKTNSLSPCITRRFVDTVKSVHGRLAPTEVDLLSQVLLRCRKGDVRSAEKILAAATGSGISPNDTCFATMAMHYVCAGNPFKCMKYLEKVATLEAAILNIIFTSFVQSQDLSGCRFIVSRFGYGRTFMSLDAHRDYLALLAKRGQIRALEEYFVGALSNPSDMTEDLNFVLSQLIRCGRYSMASLFSPAATGDQGLIRGGRGIPIKAIPDKYTFTALIRANVELGDWPTSIQLFHNMTKHGIQPDLVLFNQMLHGLSKSANFRVHLQFVLTELGKAGLSATTRTFNILIGELITGKFLDAALWWNQHMQECALDPDAVTWNNRLQLFALTGQMNQAETVLGSMQETGQPINARSVSYMVKGYCHLGRVNHAELLSKWVQEQNMPFSYETVAGLIRYHLDSGNRAEALSALESWMNNMSIRKQQLHAGPFRSFIYWYGVKQKNLRQSLLWWGRMLSCGVQPDLSTYTCLIQVHSHCKDGSIESVRHLYRWIRSHAAKEGLVLDATTVCVVLDACGIFQDHATLDEVWNGVRSGAGEAQITNLEWENVYNSYIEALGRCGEIRRMTRVLVHDMAEQNILPSEKTFTTCLTFLRMKPEAGSMVDDVELFRKKHKSMLSATGIYIRDIS
ncbi:hypothetical protein DFS34DRAFT_410390 [Phlyctochytrium arcticum]|nr:hypothetical protein DFS34DRAFT_410390 [Phlyctochytrium arcticum]